MKDIFEKYLNNGDNNNYNYLTRTIIIYFHFYCIDLMPILDVGAACPLLSSS